MGNLQTYKRLWIHQPLCTCLMQAARAAWVLYHCKQWTCQDLQHNTATVILALSSDHSSELLLEQVQPPQNRVEYEKASKVSYQVEHDLWASRPCHSLQSVLSLIPVECLDETQFGYHRHENSLRVQVVVTPKLIIVPSHVLEKIISVELLSNSIV